MKTQGLFDRLKANARCYLCKKDYQKYCAILGNIKRSYEIFYTTESFGSAKKSVSKIQSYFSKLKNLLDEKDQETLGKFVSSCQREINANGHQEHERFMELLEYTGANIFRIPSYTFSTSSDDYDEWVVARRMAEALR